MFHWKLTGSGLGLIHPPEDTNIGCSISKLVKGVWKKILNPQMPKHESSLTSNPQSPNPNNKNNNIHNDRLMVLRVVQPIILVIMVRIAIIVTISIFFLNPKSPNPLTPTSSSPQTLEPKIQNP